MQGKCPGCGREYEISDDFVAMGGTAKCPHCVRELVFPSRDEDRETRRLLDQTRIDPNRANSVTRVEPDEVDARCPDCSRLFKVDSQYLRMGGDAKCPHCGQTLVFDVPSQPPAPKPPDEDLWSDNTSQTVEVGSMAQDTESPDQGDEPSGFEVDLEHSDPYSAIGDMELPELSDIRQDADSDYDADSDHMATEVMSAPQAMEEDDFGHDDMPTPDEDDEGFTDGVLNPPVQEPAESSLEDMDVMVGDLVAGFSEVDESSSDRDDNAASLSKSDFASGSVVGLDESAEYSDSTKEMDGYMAAGLIESSTQPTSTGHETESIDEYAPVDGAGALVQKEFSEEGEFSGGEDLFEDEALPEDLSLLPEASFDSRDNDVVVGVLETDDPADNSEEDALVADGQSPSQEAMSVADSGQPHHPADDAVLDSGHGDSWVEDDSQFAMDQDSLLLLDRQEDESEVSFAGLASSEDWATAAAAWAESGFSSDQMPEFIKSEPPPAEPQELSEGESEEDDGDELLSCSTRTLKDGDSLEEVKSRGALEDADSVEVSDADILEIGADEVEQIPAQVAGHESSVDNKAVLGRVELSSRHQATPVAPTKASVGGMDMRGLLEKLWNPPVLAGVLGVLAILIVGLFWFLTASEDDIKAVEFPSNGIKAKVIQAPAPALYKAKNSAVKHYGLGNRQAYLGHFEDALDEYQKACRLDPGFPNPHRAMGAVYAALGKWKLSRTAYETYLRLSPKGPDSGQIKDIIRKYNKRK